MVLKIKSNEICDGTQNRNGQGLVEMAIITPILIIMFIGLFEVGWFMWGYMNILNVSREAARFAVKPGAIDVQPIESGGYVLAGYENVITHTLVTAADPNLHLREYLKNARDGDAGPQAQIIITLVGLSTGVPCEPPEACYSHVDEVTGILAPKCDKTATSYSDYPDDDVFISPDLYPTSVFMYPDTITKSRISDYDTRLADMKDRNDSLNCQFGFSRNYYWTSEASIIVEIYYEQPQLLGFPLFTWMGDPVPIYVQTTMRQEDFNIGLADSD